MASEIRVSCGSMCRFTIDGQYLLLLNQNRRKKEFYELSPIGGAIEFEDVSLLKRFKARPEKPGKQDLRLYIDYDFLSDFRTWFHQRRERETDPFREVYEELVDEAGVLGSLRREDLTIRFLHITEDLKTTSRQGMTGVFTQYFLEIFEVYVKEPSIKLPLQNPPRNSGAVWLDEATARKGDPLHMVFDGKEREVKLNTEYLFR